MIKNYNKKRCKMCGNWFSPTSGNHNFCGTLSNKNKCSGKNYYQSKIKFNKRYKKEHCDNVIKYNKKYRITTKKNKIKKILSYINCHNEENIDKLFKKIKILGLDE